MSLKKGIGLDEFIKKLLTKLKQTTKKIIKLIFIFFFSFVKDVFKELN